VKKRERMLGGILLSIVAFMMILGGVIQVAEEGRVSYIVGIMFGIVLLAGGITLIIKGKAG